MDKNLKRDNFPVQKCIDLGIWIQRGKQMCCLILYDVLLKSVPMYMVISRNYTCILCRYFHHELDVLLSD